MASSNIFNGPWMNYAEETAAGSTITLSSRNANLLVAFLAFFVTITGSFAWGIVRFIVHQTRARQIPHLALHHQQQAVLRNSSSAISTAYKLVRVAFAWRKSKVRAVARSVLLVLLAICVFAVFAVASIFSSEVTKASSSDFLIKSPHCGVYSYGDIYTNKTLEAAQAQKSNLDTISADTYVRKCYGQNLDTNLCSQYAAQDIASSENVNATCPFGNNICFYNNASAYQVDSGFIDSNQKFGLNVPKNQRVFIRFVTTCAPIKTSGYRKFINNTESEHFPGFIGDTFEFLFYGPYDGNNFTHYYDERAILGTVYDIS
jgi:hypothetical protein